MIQISASDSVRRLFLLFLPRLICQLRASIVSTSSQLSPARTPDLRTNEGPRQHPQNPAKPTPPPTESQLATPRSLDKCAGPAPTSVPRLNTAYLVPYTHKIGSGNVTVLPSLSLLVDLREGERRKGWKGNEVLVISPDGTDVKVYSAPHLSTPCCLVEPVAQYGVDDLPAVYRKQYATAMKVVNGLKERIPKVRG